MPHDWSPEEDALLGVMPDREVARRIGVSAEITRNRRLKLGIPAYRPPPRQCRVCEKPALGRAGFCPLHRQRWRRWGKPDPEEWARAFIEGRLLTCDVCGVSFNGNLGWRYCSQECLEESQRERALERFRNMTGEEKQRAMDRHGERMRRKRQSAWHVRECVSCGEPFRSHPVYVTCGNVVCQRRNMTEQSRNHRARIALADLDQAANELERRANNERESQSGSEG